MNIKRICLYVTLVLLMQNGEMAYGQNRADNDTTKTEQKDKEVS